jgi:uncharacterized metal-binding protein YceD (DUF177 family)
MVENGNFDVQVELIRSERLIEVNFKIKGITVLECGKTLKPFDFEIDVEQKIIYKFATEYEDISDELIHIPFDFQQLNLAQPIYEFISTAIPMRRIHPDLALEEEAFDLDDDDDSLTFIYSSLDEEDDVDLDDSNHDNSDDNDDDDDIDPRWGALKKLK